MLNTLKNNWKIIVLIAVLIIGLVGYLYFEASTFGKLSIVIISIYSLWLFFSSYEKKWLTYLTLFLVMSDIYNSHIGLDWSFSIIIVSVILTVWFLYILTCPYSGKLNKLYIILICILELEIFLSLILWPINSIGKSLILVSSFWAFTEIVHLKKEKQLTNTRVYVISALYLVAMVLVILTSIWESY